MRTLTRLLRTWRLEKIPKKNSTLAIRTASIEHPFEKQRGARTENAWGNSAQGG
jgi:hypothetical protein